MNSVRKAPLGWTPPRVSTVSVCLTVIPVLVTACSAGPEAADRNAATSGQPDEAASAASSEDASPSAVQGAFVKDVNWCFTNNGQQTVRMYFGSSLLPRPETYELSSSEQGGPTGGGSTGEGGPVDLATGMTACSSGRYAIGEDRHAEITFANGRKTDFAAYNPSLERPQFFYDWQGDFTRGYDSFSEGDTRTCERHYNRWIVKRLDDTGTKEFRISFEGEIPPA